MPGGDRTGPNGMGSMTGRGAGFCADNSAPGYASPMPGRGYGRGAGRGGGMGYGRGAGRGFAPWGGGRGRAWGGGRGQGWGQGQNMGWNSGPQAAYPEPTAEQEASYLKGEAEALESELQAIKARIGDLESQK
ncbi:MAG: DUF5320 domain-containing protein [Candidatus Alcyoniella australis]|nr:DUF5320 domain-containing protein [Candidatus Alcyoniella australis]